MLRLVFLSAFAAILSVSQGLAEGGQVIAPPAPPVVIAPVAGFDGGYVGLEFGTVTGDFDAESGARPFGPVGMQDGDAYGIFAGYNWQRGSLVAGGEVRYLNFDGYTGTIDPTLDVENMFDLRGRLGFAGERFFVYGAVGYSLGSGTIPTASVEVDGINYGVGAEFNVGESVFLGIDYTGRELDGDGGGFSFEGSADTVTLRVGFRF